MLEPVFSQTSSGEDTFDRLQGHIGFLPMDLVHPRDRFIVGFSVASVLHVQALCGQKRCLVLLWDVCVELRVCVCVCVCLMCGAAVSLSILLPCDHIVLFKPFPFRSLCVSLWSPFLWQSFVVCKLPSFGHYRASLRWGRLRWFLLDTADSQFGGAVGKEPLDSRRVSDNGQTIRIHTKSI